MIRFAALRERRLLLLALAHVLAAGCSPDEAAGPNPPPPRGSVTTGLLEVSMASDGPPLNVSVTISGTGTWALRSNEGVRVDRLLPGEYRVSLALLPPTPAGVACQIRNGSERVATVRAGLSTVVRFQVDCTVSGRPRERDPA